MTSDAILQAGFNSKLVRLEVEKAVSHAEAELGFNSKLVRLEDNLWQQM